MDVFNATMIAEGAIPAASEEQELEAWQLQGFFGRTASALIEQGLIQPFPRH